MIKGIFNNVAAANDNGGAPAAPADTAGMDIRDLLKQIRAGRPAGKKPKTANDNPRDPDRELLRAAEAGNLDDVKKWLKQGANINARHVNNDTPLIIAAREGHEEVVTYLATLPKNAADPSLANNSGETALTVATRGGATKIALRLIKAGAPLDAQEENGATAVFHAAQTGNDTLIAALAEAKADLDIPDNKKTTPLIQSVKFGQTKATAALLDGRANIDAQDEHGMTALMHAVKSGSNLVTRALLLNGADVEIKDAQGKTAIDMAEDKGLRDLVDFMEATLKALNAERYDAFHTGTRAHVPAMKPLTLKPAGETP